MRILRLMIVIAAMLGGAIGYTATVNAAPMPVAGVVGQASEAPLVEKTYWRYRRRFYRPYYRPRFYYRPRYYRPRYYYGPRFYRRRFFF